MNIPSFTIPGLMPTTHPVADGIQETARDGSVSWDFLTVPTSDNQPVSFTAVMYSYSGTQYVEIPSEALGTHFTSTVSGTDTVYTFKFGADEEGFVPAGTFMFDVVCTFGDATKQTKVLTVSNPDTMENKSTLNRRRQDTTVDLSDYVD